MIEYVITVYTNENSIVRIHKPILTEDERSRRIEEIKKALIEFEISRRSIKK